MNRLLFLSLSSLIFFLSSTPTLQATYLDQGTVEDSGGGAHDASCDRAGAGIYQDAVVAEWVPVPPSRLSDDYYKDMVSEVTLSVAGRSVFIYMARLSIRGVRIYESVTMSDTRLATINMDKISQDTEYNIRHLANTVVRQSDDSLALLIVSDSRTHVTPWTRNETLYFTFENAEGYLVFQMINNALRKVCSVENTEKKK